MKRSSTLATLAAIAAFNAFPAVADHPIAGVIALLEKLEVETKQEAAVEAESFQKFQYWCKRSTRMLTRAIKKEKKLIGEMKDKIEGLSADIMTLGEDIAALEKQLEVLDQQKEQALYQDDIENLDGSIEATDVAIEVMEEEDHDDMLLQTGAQHVNRKKAVKAGGDPADLLKLDPGASNPFKPKAKAFSAHSGGGIETFKGLEDGWGIDKLSEEEQETNAINAYKLAKQARDSAIGAAQRSKAQKESIKSDKESAKAQAESDKAEQE